MRALACLLLTGCFAGVEPNVEPAPGVKVGWRQSYVVLHGDDPDVPDHVPAKGCEPRGQVSVTTSEKIDVADPLRRGAQDLGGNAVDNIRETSHDGGKVTVVGDVFRCPWPTDETTAPKKR